MGIPTVQPYLTLGDLERSKARSSRFSVVGDLDVVHMPVIFDINLDIT